MNRNKTIFLLLILVYLLSINTFAQNSEQTLSPYFIVKSKSGNEHMPLLETNANVNIVGIIADVEINQIYKNEGESAIEAIYIFPISNNAAIYSMQFQIGNRIIEAEIQEKEKARKNYEEAKKKGKTASLLEQLKPNVFKMNVANILPGDTINVSVKYTEQIIPREGEYTFVYPTVVGPRYTGEKKTDNIIANKDNGVSYTKQGEAAQYNFDINVNIISSIDIESFICETHQIISEKINNKHIKIHLDKIENKGGNRDFILNYNFKDNKISTGTLLYETKRENYFMSVIQPPKNIKKTEVPQREHIFIVDVSGSMHGFPLDISRNLISDILTNLDSTEYFNILFFAGGANILFAEGSQPATESNIKKAFDIMQNFSGSGGTNLLNALNKAMKYPKKENYSRIFSIFTDGYISVEREALQIIEQNLGNANFFTFGIGASVNRYNIESMANAGKGEFFVATKKTESQKIANRFKKYINNPYMTSITVNYKGLKVYDIMPQKVHDLFANRPIILIGKYKGAATGYIEISGYSGNEKLVIKELININNKTENNSALEQLWAREKIKYLDDFNANTNKDINKKDIIKLSLKHNILTRFTSFIAIDKMRRNDGKIVTVKQANPLPKGVSNKAVGLNEVQPFNENIEFEIEHDVEFIEIEEEPEEEEQEVFVIVEDMPEFPGGQAALQKYIAENLKYPELARKNHIEGTVYVQFIVNEKGQITDVKVLRGVDPLLDAEAIRVIKSLPKFMPGKARGKPQKVRFVMPIKFKLK